MQVAARKTYGQDRRTGSEMVQGLFFYRVRRHSGDKAVEGEVPRSIPVPPDSALPGTAGGNAAPSGAKPAPDQGGAAFGL